MPSRLAASLALLVFAISLVAGIQAGNTIATVLSRGLVAMAGTMAIAWVVGAMAQRMVDENLRAKEQELRDAAQANGAPDAPSQSDGHLSAGRQPANKNVGR
ncbi:MAG TPA: hypothetical protein VF796_00785 [Humisphaera sp.]